MKLDKTTFEILKNFSQINSNLVINEGNIIRTINPGKTAFAKAVVPNTFEKEFAVYDLNELLALVSGNDADLIFGENAITITDPQGMATFNYSDPDVVQTPPSAEMPVPEGFYSIEISATTLAAWRKNVGILAAPLIVFTSDGTTAKVTIGNPDITSSSKYESTLGASENVFKAAIPTESLKMMEGDYLISFPSTGKFAYFSSKDKDLKYWIALDSKHSEFK
jgi:hypothetical protein